MIYSRIRTLFLLTITLALLATFIRLVWEIPDATVLASLAVIVTCMLVVVAVNALAIYLLISPSVEKLKSRLVGIWTVAIFTIGFAGSILHYVRFVPSERADDPLSKLIATLLLLASFTAYILVLWAFQVVWRRKT